MLHLIGEYEEFERDFKKRVIVNGTSVLVTLLAGKLYAIQDKCTHLGASLSKGNQTGQEIQCRAHGAKFDMTSGDVLEKAHIGFIKMPTKKLKTFPTVVKEGKVFIEM